MMTDTKRWAFTFQNYVQLTMYETHKLAVPSSKENERKLNLIERSLHSARWVFVENHKKKVGYSDFIVAQQNRKTLKGHDWEITIGSMQFQILQFRLVHSSNIVHLRSKLNLSIDNNGLKYSLIVGSKLTRSSGRKRVSGENISDI